MSESVRHQVCAQLGAALDAATAVMDAPGPFTSVRASGRGGSRVMRLVRLVLAMDARNLIDEGALPSSFPYLRKRYAEKRQPRVSRKPRITG
jgi:hypothetical protein